MHLNSTIRRGLAAAAALLVSAMASAPASATLLQIDAQGTVDGTFSSSASYIAVGTVITASVQLDVSGSGPGFPTIGSASGTFTWNDGTPRTFTLDGSLGFTSLGGTGSTGVYAPSFGGTGPTIGGIVGSAFGFTFDLAVNPNVSTASWDSILLGATIRRLGFGGDFAGGGSGFYCGSCVAGNVSGSISRVAVPEPGTLALLGGALVVLSFMRRRRAA